MKTIADGIARIAMLDNELLPLSSSDDAASVRLVELVALRLNLIQALVPSLNHEELQELRVRTARLEQHWRDRRQEWTQLLAGSDRELRQMRLFAEPSAADALLLDRLG